MVADVTTTGIIWITCFDIFIIEQVLGRKSLEITEMQKPDR
jgi:hypothetical protein